MSWDHSADYPLPSFKDWTSAGGSSGFTKTYKLGGEHAFLTDHVVDGRILMPVRPFLLLRLSLAIARWMLIPHVQFSLTMFPCMQLEGVPFLAPARILLPQKRDSNINETIPAHGDHVKAMHGASTCHTSVLNFHC